jgi:eukaryotic-like serine/threonine-protein kinase
MSAVPDQQGADREGVGDLLAGRYRIGPLVGLGGTAEVYRAFDHERGRAVAVKIFRPGSTPAPGYGGARELEVLAGFSHPGLVGVLDAGVDEQGCPFVVMDFVDGRSLAARLHDGPLAAAAVARLGAVLAEALAAVHARGVVHRDVKPANVLLDADGRPWLTDFGIARIVDATRVTATGVVVGTAAYMAPEQVRGESVGPTADVYALGLVLLEAVTGRREYEGGALESALARLHRAPRIPDEVPEPLAFMLRRMTVLDPAERPAAADVAATLRRPPAVAGPVRVRPTARRAAPVAALACLVAAALAGGLTLTGAEQPAGAPARVEAAEAAPAVVLAAPPATSALSAEPAVIEAPDPSGAAVALAGTPGGRTVPRPSTRVVTVVDARPDPEDVRSADEPATDGRSDSSPNRERAGTGNQGGAANDVGDDDKKADKKDDKKKDQKSDGGSGKSGKKEKSGHGGKG